MKNLKKRHLICLLSAMVLTFGWCLVGSAFGSDKPAENAGMFKKPGLLIIAHGAPSPQWNKPVLALEDQVVKALGKNNPFEKVKVCLMEFASPTVADGVKELEQAGCDGIIAVPLLIAPSSHSHWDIPTLLGLYSDEKMVQELKQEGAKLVKSRIPITLIPTMSAGDLLPRVMLDRVKELSKNPQDEAVVILAHGEESMQGHWTNLMKRIAGYICGKTGITYADWAFVHVGQSYDNALAVINHAGEQRKRVIVVGCYLSMGVDRMHHHAMEKWEKFQPGSPMEGIEIVPAKKGILPDERLVKWVAESARKALSNR